MNKEAFVEKMNLIKKIEDEEKNPLKRDAAIKGVVDKMSEEEIANLFIGRFEEIGGIIAKTMQQDPELYKEVMRELEK